MKYGNPITRNVRNYGRKRAATLSLVYVLMGLHIAHWRIAGKTLAPLELNEVMYTLELGIVTAGFLFMAVAVLSVLVFGRFFCSWGCHILALEDLCAWLLGKIGIKPRPIRSRLLLLVPPAAAFYMFLWPQVGRLLRGEALPGLHVRGEGDAWASFVTDDYWRNLPGPWIAGLTFLVCGFAVVYVLGSRSFCRYACPYGAIFGLADRFAPGRIAAVGGCSACGRCTAVCQSQVRVHEELIAYGTVVDPGCLKDLDCIAVCPNDAIGYRFRRPAFFKSWRRLVSVDVRPSLDRAENVLMGVVFVAALFTFRGLYGLVPFLMTLALAGILAFLAVIGLRLVRVESVRLKPFHLKRSGRLTSSGRAYVCVNAALLALFAHSAFIRTNEALGSRVFERVERGGPRVAVEAPEAVRAAITRLERVERWGLVESRDLEHKLARLHLRSAAPERAEPYLRRIIAHNPNSLATRIRLADVLHGTGRTEPARAEVHATLAALEACPDLEYVATVQCAAHELLGEIEADANDTDGAIAEYEAALAARPESTSAHLALGNLLAASERMPEALVHFKALVELEPESAPAHYNMGVLLSTLGRPQEALWHYRRAAGLDSDDPEVQNNLGFLLAALGDRRSAQRHFERALLLRPGFAHAHFNLGRLLLEEGRVQQGEPHLEEAARLDARYAELLARMRAGPEPGR